LNTRTNTRLKNRNLNKRCKCVDPWKWLSSIEWPLVLHSVQGWLLSMVVKADVFTARETLLVPPTGLDTCQTVTHYCFHMPSSPVADPPDRSANFNATRAQTPSYQLAFRGSTAWVRSRAVREPHSDTSMLLSRYACLTC